MLTHKLDELSDGDPEQHLIQLLHSGPDTRPNILAPLALDLVPAPAPEAYAERVFSVCSDLTTGKRNRTSKTLERRVFLKMNKKTLDELTSTAYTLQNLD